MVITSCSKSARLRNHRTGAKNRSAPCCRGPGTGSAAQSEYMRSYLLRSASLSAIPARMSDAIWRSSQQPDASLVFLATSV
jgi:hypothetical protein